MCAPRKGTQGAREGVTSGHNAGQPPLQTLPHDGRGGAQDGAQDLDDDEDVHEFLCCDFQARRGRHGKPVGSGTRDAHAVDALVLWSVRTRA